MRYDAPGRYRMGFAEYCKLKAVNASSLLKLRKSPKAYKYAVEHREEVDSEPLRVGRAIHTAVLEPDRFLHDFALWTGGRRYGKNWDGFKAAADDRGQTILREQDYKLALRVRDAVRSHVPAMRHLGRGGEAEVTLLWEHKDGNRIQRCKGRIDYLTDAGVIVDLKSTRHLEPGAFARDAARLSYHTRAAYYQDGAREVYGERFPFLLVAVEKEEPFDVAVYRVPQDALDVGRAEYQSLLSTLADCVERNRWPGVVADEQDLTFPEWIHKDTDPAPTITMGGVPLL